MSDHCCGAESPRPTLLARFIWSLILNAGLAIGEIVMSLITGSTALLADGLNNLDDTAALLLRIYCDTSPADRRRTFGHQRMDVLAGFAKGCFLLFAAVLIVYKAAYFLTECVALSLQQRLAAVYQQYEQARQQASRYDETILKKARRNLDLNRQCFEAGESAYLGVLTAQRSCFQARLAWLNALEQLWSATVQIEGLLLSDSLM